MKPVNFKILLIVVFTAFLLNVSEKSWGLASNNIPLDSPIYLYLEKFAGFGLIESDVKGLRPYSKSEAARLLYEAEENLDKLDGEALVFAVEIDKRLRELIPREAALRRAPQQTPIFDFTPLSAARFRYVYLDGVPRDYNRDVLLKGGGKAFGFIGGDLRQLTDAIVHKSGTEGTPLLENNEGVIYRQGHNYEFRWDMEAHLTNKTSLLLEPILISTPDNSGMERDIKLALQKGYVKLGGGGLELEIGRDANWFGPGYRGTVTLTNNAKNFDEIKLSSPEPLDIQWIKKYIGDFKYAFIFSRFDETGTGVNLRRPYFIGIKLALKPNPWFEIGGNFVRQEGGPGFSGSTSIQDLIFGGGYTNKSNTIAGLDLRFRIPWLRNTEIYGEYAGEDSALFWPFLESYVAGFYIPRLTSSGKDDLRFEFFWGHPALYSDFKFPEGYTNNDMTVGHSQGGAAIEFFGRYSHWFSTRNNIAFEYFHTDRGREGRVGDQQTEEKNAWRAFWNLPIYGDVDMGLMYGWERINNFNLVGGADKTNQIFKIDISYRY